MGIHPTFVAWVEYGKKAEIFTNVIMSNGLFSEQSYCRLKGDSRLGSSHLESYASLFRPETVVSKNFIKLPTFQLPYCNLPQGTSVQDTGKKNTLPRLPELSLSFQATQSPLRVVIVCTTKVLLLTRRTL